LIEPVDGTPIFPGELMEPHINILRHQHQLRHPFEIETKAFRFFLHPEKFINLRRSTAPKCHPPQFGNFFLFNQVETAEKSHEIRTQ
jgi:hypothetical protein